MNILENISLKEHTTFNIGGPAQYFVEVSTIDELQKVISFAKEKSLPFLVLGGGSNVLISDKGFSGIVIKMNIKGIEEIKRNNNHRVLIAGAGEDWDAFVGYAVSKNLYGIENLSLIPGSVGAAPVQNIGAYGSEVKDTIEWVEVYNTETNSLEIFDSKKCEFGYRDSIFKKINSKKYIITHVAFLLSEDGKLNTEYRDIKKYIEEHKLSDLTLGKIRDIVTDIRIKKLPDVKKIGTAGSFFKNPIITREHYETLKNQYPELPGFATNNPSTIKVSAAWILDNICGFKGYRQGEVGVYKNQALVLVNFGNATAQEIAMLAEKMIVRVKEKTNIILEKEVQFI